MANPALSWLKRIFSATTLTVIVAIATLAVSIFSYIDSKSGTLELQINNVSIPMDYAKDNKIYFICLEIAVGDLYYNDVLNNAHLPILQNKSSRSVKNFCFDIECYDDFYFNYCNGAIRDDYERVDSSYHYKSNIIYSHKSLKCSPFYSLEISPTNSYEHLGHLCFIYDVTYEGLDWPIKFFYELYIIDSNVFEQKADAPYYGKEEKEKLNDIISKIKEGLSNELSTTEDKGLKPIIMLTIKNKTHILECKDTSSSLNDQIVNELQKRMVGIVL